VILTSALVAWLAAPVAAAAWLFESRTR
jgi:hypothetical protein